MRSNVMKARKLLALSLAVAASSALAAPPKVPTEVSVPKGNVKALMTKAVGTVAWTCEKNDDGASWTFAGPAAVLYDEQGKPAVSYYGPPATWGAMDGSLITGTQLATAPAGDGNIPYQLVKANESEHDGRLKDVTYIQRLNLDGGAAPATGCNAESIGKKTLVAYTGEYVFWKKK